MQKHMNISTPEGEQFYLPLKADALSSFQIMLLKQYYLSFDYAVIDSNNIDELVDNLTNPKTGCIR